MTCAVALLCGSALAAFPSASAHECADHDPAKCNSGTCVEGEDHEHTDYNDDQEDGYCKTTAEEGSCKYYGQTHPRVVCELLKNQRV